MADAQQHLITSLRTELEKQRCVWVLGAGVAVAASDNDPCSSWTGLLKNGVARASELRGLSNEWRQRLTAQITSGDPVELVLAASNITKRLHGPTGGEFRRWLRETVGSLSVRNDTLITAITAAGGPIATTNYDSLIEQVTGLQPSHGTTTPMLRELCAGRTKG